LYFHFIEFAEVGEAVVVGAQCGELLTLKFTFHCEEHLEAARTCQAVEVVGAGQARDVGYAVDLDEVAPGFAVFQHAQDCQCGK
jgi:hypothetical protein